MADEKNSTAGLAVASLALGISGVLCLGPLGAVPAVVCGHLALRRIRGSGGGLRGEGIAIGGLALGYGGLAVMVFVLPLLFAIAVPSFVRARDAEQRAVCVNHMHVLAEAKREAAFTHSLQDGQSVEETELRAHLHEGFGGIGCPKGGVYSINPVGQDPSCSVHGSMSSAEAACMDGPQRRESYP